MAGEQFPAAVQNKDRLEQSAALAERAGQPVCPALPAGPVKPTLAQRAAQVADATGKPKAGGHRHRGAALRRFMRHGGLLLVCALVMSACAQPRTESSPVPEFGPPVALAINGFNYTDLVISYFAVGSAGGGNIYVSSPTSGGGGTSCCMRWRPGTSLPQPVTIEWMRLVNGRDRWCKKTVQIAGPVPANPTALGVHFMPNGDIQVEITAGYPKLKLRLENFDDGRRKESGNVIHDEQVARCRDGR